MRWAMLTLGVWGASCTCASRPPGPFFCATTADCADDFVCIDNTCVLRTSVVPDSGIPGSFSIAPRSGPIGTLLTLSRGVEVDFTHVVSARVGEVPAIVVNTSSTTMQVLVMPGSTSGPVTLQLRGGVSATSEPFEVTRLDTPFTQRDTKLRPSDALGHATMGSAVAVSADGTTILAGGSGDSVAVGAAWVFARIDGGWAQQGPKLVGTGSVGSGRQGRAVALSADGNTAALGAYLDDGRIGAVWVFVRDAGVWSQQGPKLTGTDATWSEPQQGSSVSLSADGNTLLSGAPLEARAGPGAAWVFTRSEGAWTQHARLAPQATGTTNSYAGRPAVLSADGQVAAIGGYNDSRGIGAAWLFTRHDTEWTEGAKLVGTDFIGVSNQGSGGLALNANGSIAATGSITHDANRGAAWIFAAAPDGGWGQRAGPLTPSDLSPPSESSSSVALDAEGRLLAIGGPNDESLAGGTWLFISTDGGWAQWGAKLRVVGADRPCRQGEGTALSSDGRTLVVGGPNDEDSTGSVWVFTR